MSLKVLSASFVFDGLYRGFFLPVSGFSFRNEITSQARLLLLKFSNLLFVIAAARDHLGL